MDADRGAVYGATLVVFLAAVASGPLVGGVDLTHEPEVLALDPGEGSVTVTSVEVPEEGFRLERGKFGSEVYYLVTPPVRVGVADVEGQPLLNFKVRIDDAGYSSLRIHFLSEEEERAGGLNVTMPRDSMDPSVGEEDSYRGEIILVVRDDGGRRVVHRENVTIEVVG